MPKLDTNAEQMRGHAQRNQDGALRRIRGDTKVETLEKRYDVDFGVRGDMRWDTLKEKLGVDSVGEALRKAGR